MNLHGIAVRNNRTGVAIGVPVGFIVVGSMSFTVTAAAAGAGPTVDDATPSPVVVTARWQLEDPVTSEVYSFPINPHEADSPEYVRVINEMQTTTGQPITHEGAQPVPIWTISGHISSQAMHDALLAWSRKPNKIFITDDLVRTWIVYIREFQHVPRLGEAIWEGSYSMKLLVFKQVV